MPMLPIAPAHRCGSVHCGDGVIEGDRPGSGTRCFQCYDSSDYTYNYGHDSTGSNSFLSESWMTSYPASSNDGAKHMGPGKDSYGLYDWMDSYGPSEPYRGYGSQRTYLPLSGWRHETQRGYRDHLRPSPSNGGSGRLMTQAASPELARFHSLRAFTVNSYFGGGFKQKSRKLWKEKNKQSEGGPPVKKARECAEEDETKSEESEGEKDGAHEATRINSKTDGDDKPEGAVEREIEQKQMLTEKQQMIHGRSLRDRMVERIQFVCSLCKFRTFYNKEMTSHLQSEFHKELFRYVEGRLPSVAANFLQEYILHKNKKTEERCKAIKDLSTTIQQIFRDQDLTQDLGMEHFVKKVETAHCAACDVFIPMNFRALQKHIRSPQHNQNRRNMMENSKKTALGAARSILDNKLMREKLDCYMKGQNPFSNQTEAIASTSAGVDTATEGQEPVTNTEEHFQKEQEGSTTTSSVNEKNTEDSAGFV